VHRIRQPPRCSLRNATTTPGPINSNVRSTSTPWSARNAPVGRPPFCACWRSSPTPSWSLKSSTTSTCPAMRPRWHLPACLRMSFLSWILSSQATTSSTLTIARHNPKTRSAQAAAHRNCRFRAHPPSHFLLIRCQSRTGPHRSIPSCLFVRKMDAHRPVSHPRKPPLFRNHCSLTSA